jgi:signal transduction histidine kinase
MAHEFRLSQVQRAFNMRLEERVNERTRISRELHDTLLQSFHGLLLRFQGARNLLPGRASDAGQALDAAIDDAARAITEARDAVQNLRSSTVLTNELARALEMSGKELLEEERSANKDATAFSIEVEGSSQELHPIVRDEVYRISAEALRNAFRHARAKRIKVEIQYDARHLRVRVQDDGVGIDANRILEGRAGHYGIPGMRERAKGIGGQMEVRSEHGTGTKVELTIPASAAYAVHAGGRFRLFKGKPRTSS